MKVKQGDIFLEDIGPELEDKYFWLVTKINKGFAAIQALSSEINYINRFSGTLMPIVNDYHGRSLNRDIKNIGEYTYIDISEDSRAFPWLGNPIFFKNNKEKFYGGWY